MKKQNTLHQKVTTLLLAAALLAGCGGAGASSSTAAPAASSAAAAAGQRDAEAVQIALSADGVAVNGQAAGTTPAAVYLSNDIIYYEDRDSYASGNPYGEGTAAERHSADEAAAHTVVNITAPGRYELTGTLPKGQIRVDLGEEAAEDPAAVVTLILNGADITCTVAPAILFLNVYECDNNWSTETAQSTVDTAAAGANLILAEGSSNLVKGGHVARIYKDAEGEKKLWKQDGAIYSYMSMNVDGTGSLDLTADNEGLDTELHLTINGGAVNIRSGNDGINTNEDGVSVTTINGGSLHIIAGLGEEGDGIDSNGWLVINGGTVVASANPAADAGLDSDMGSYINGGTVVALGSTMDWAESDSKQVTMNLQFAQYQQSDSALVVTDLQGNAVFAYAPAQDEVLGANTRRYMGAILSSPAFEQGQSYQVFVGGTVTGSETGGVYTAVESVQGGVQQSYSGTDVTMRPGGMGGFGGGKGEFNGEQPQRPEGELPQMPEGFAGGRGQRPDGQQPALPEGEPPELPAGSGMMQPGQRPEGEMPQRPENFGAEMPGNAGEAKANTVFYMQDKVNCFSGVAAMAEE